MSPPSQCFGAEMLQIFTSHSDRSIEWSSLKFRIINEQELINKKIINTKKQEDYERKRKMTMKSRRKKNRSLNSSEGWIFLVLNNFFRMMFLFISCVTECSCTNHRFDIKRDVGICHSSPFSPPRVFSTPAAFLFLHDFSCRIPRQVGECIFEYIRFKERAMGRKKGWVRVIYVWQQEWIFGVYMLRLIL